MKATKEVYVRPVLTKHYLLRDITAAYSGGGGGIKDLLRMLSAGFFPVSRAATKTVASLVSSGWIDQRMTLDFAPFRS